MDSEITVTFGDQPARIERERRSRWLPLVQGAISRPGEWASGRSVQDTRRSLASSKQYVDRLLTKLTEEAGYPMAEWEMQIANGTDGQPRLFIRVTLEATSEGGTR